MQITFDNTFLLAVSILTVAIAILILTFVVWKTGRRHRVSELERLLEDQATAMKALASERFSGQVNNLVNAEVQLYGFLMERVATALDINRPPHIPIGKHPSDEPSGIRATVTEEIVKKIIGLFNGWVGVPSAK